MHNKRKSKRLIMPCLATVLLFFSLAARASFTQSFLPRSYYGAKLEPLSTVLHGAGQCYWDNGTVKYRQALKGLYDPAVINDYVGVGGKASAVDRVIGKLMKGWLAKFPKFCALQLGLSIPGVAADVANGTYDRKINYIFTALNGLERPIYLRIGYECNGSWNHYQTLNYKDAFARVTNLLRNHPLGSKAATVWCIAAGGSSRYMDWYPGDQYVDWWSIDIFAPDEINSSTTRNYIKDAVGHKKPVMIGESTPKGIGVKKGLQSWNAWFKPYFDLIHSNPGIKAFNYINWNWDEFTQYDGWGDCRIGRNAVVTSLYAQEMASPLYLHASTMSGFFDNVTPIAGAPPTARKHPVMR